MPVLLVLLCGSIVLLCGCTRREQLVLEAEGLQETVREAEGAQETVREAEGTQETVKAAEGTQGTVQEAGRTNPGGLQAAGAAEEPGRIGQVPETAGGSEEGAADFATEGSGPASRGEAETDTTGQPQGQVPQEAVMICVHVCGAVKHAGVYELPEGSRVFEAVNMAGGFTEEADENYVNQAQRLSDGSKLVIPTAEQAQSVRADGGNSTEQIGIVEQAAVSRPEGYGAGSGPGGDAGGADIAPDGKVNINTASEAQLCKIPGIGAVRAAAIVAYRQESGGFGSIEDIMNVSGIKEGTYAKIKDSISVD